MQQLTTIIIILTALSTALNAQEIVTDRPDQTESSTTIPGNSFQMELGFGSGNGDLFYSAAIGTGLSEKLVIGLNQIM